VNDPLSTVERSNHFSILESETITVPGVKDNRIVDVFAASADYRSRLRIALWSGDDEGCLVNASERCDRIRKSPRSEMSMDDSMFFMKANCPLVGGHPLKPGLDVD
jgi:hypothetical protein